MTKIRNNTVPVTGGARGTGRLMGEMRALHHEVHSCLVDVGKPEEVRSTAMKVKKETGRVDSMKGCTGSAKPPDVIPPKEQTKP